jgi:ubiquinone biosynthesis protein COQ9
VNIKTVDDETAAIIDAVVANVPFDGWTETALRRALVGVGLPAADAPVIFPGGAGEMVETYCALADQRMIAGAAGLPAEMRLTARVRAVIALRFAQNRGQKEAVRRALAVQALPANLRSAVRTAAATVDAIWFAAGDEAADFSWYTKRATLAAVYSATLLFWLHDPSPDDADTLAFLDRRLAGVGKIGKVRARLGRLVPKFA